MKYYAYILTEQNTEPLGSFGRVFFEAKTFNPKKLIKMAKDRLPKNKSFRLFSYTNFYDNNTYRLIYEYKPH